MTTLLSSTSIPPPSRVDVVSASATTTTTSPRTSPRRSVSQLRLPKIIEEDGTQRLLNVGIPNSNRCNNILITSKYTVWTFLPLTLRTEFKKFTNMYFLIVGIITAFGYYGIGFNYKQISPLGLLVPLSFFITISLLMEGLADKKRHLNDYKTNTYQCIVIANLVQFNFIPRKDIRQGNLIVIRNREMIPADTVLLASSGDLGCAYIETSSIDGETNLKLRLSAKSRSTCASNDVDVDIDEQNQQGNQGNIAVLATEAPNAHINTFTGKLSIPTTTIMEEEKDDNDNDRNTNNSISHIPLDGDNLLLRGAILRNTEWAIGVVAFTGTDTKLSQNSIEAPTKFSQLDHFTNKCVIVMLFIEFISIVALSTSASNEVWPYLPNFEPPEWNAEAENWIQHALTFVILLAYFVPLSMIFTVQCVNAFMLYLVYVDIDMYDDTTDTCAEPRSTIVTDLGQIEYIFTDKTGTLTQNVMRFKRCSIDGMIFGTPVEKSRPKNDDDNDNKVDGDDDDNELNGGRSDFHPVQQVLVGQVHVNEDGDKLESSKGLTFNAELFLRVMSLCHTVVHQHEQGPGGAPFGYAYQAESPDEGALVSESSKTFGFQVLSPPAKSSTRSSSSSGGNSNDSNGIETWSVLAINKFDSTRKRMSILLRSPPELGSAPMLLCKGADSAMLDPEIFISNGSNDSKWEITATLGIQSHLGEFASEGLRTLVLGVRFLTEDQCNDWLETYNAASTAIDNRDKKLTQAAEDIEKELHIVGATAIEDKLQVGVPDTIATLEDAGIKLWVLTGDKRETAVEIGYSTKVLTPQMHLTEFVDRGAEFKRRTLLERAFAADREVRKGLLIKHLKKEKRNEVLASSPSTPHAIVPSGDGQRALVIEGAALAHLQGDSELEELMFNIASRCDAVIACRVTPRQKAQLVKLVRHHVVPEPVTLAIGDGANDVGMIHEAHVGIGISGKEGQQAVNASDFSIGQFRFLENLVLYHGRWDYMRMTMVILYSFFKNFCLAGTLILFNTQTLFSGTTLYDQWILSGFNFVIFFPIFFLGMFDRNLEKNYVKKNPGVYKATQQKEVIAPRILLRWFLTVFVYVSIRKFLNSLNLFLILSFNVCFRVL
ncbi:phospholipid-translocating P-type ATPase [Fragilariopsis cylindrus CCMP1102]|uniref:Phospholipid-transporting ATPase n=1 Tax=Fragilariopsis cylindrus CCMP1102 TaxID=635003 RepID=A0A1E7EYR3_9STRA|nr:phospholipid-translocating P-type ATPase [Fragilariopsis cylindrus CCMP1102]|eukprot:OEU10945.1 phospholipid-translocating P-type ATPase [Fragilariopsis cylindrus CCMP1102]